MAAGVTDPSRYDLHGLELAIAVETIDPSLRRSAHLDWLLGERALSGPSGKPVATMTVCEAPAGMDMARLAGPPRPAEIGPSVATRRDDDGRWWIVCGGTVAARLDADGCTRIHVAGTEKHTAEALSDAMIFSLGHALSSRGGGLVHAACLVTPDRRGAVLLHAKSGTGKTTTALALALAGFPIAGDDTTALVAPDGGVIRAWGLPRAAKLHRRSVELMPELAPLVDRDVWDAAGEQLVTREALGAKALVTGMDEPLPVAGVIALVPASHAEAPSRQGAFDAVKSLLADNVGGGPDGLFPGHDVHFDLFATLAAGTTCLEVPVRGHPREVAQAIAEALGY